MFSTTEEDHPKKNGMYHPDVSSIPSAGIPYTGKDQSAGAFLAVPPAAVRSTNYPDGK